MAKPLASLAAGHAIYFVTFHLADSAPQTLLKRWESERDAWLEHHPKPWNTAAEREYHMRFSATLEKLLDAGHGGCGLRDTSCRRIVSEALGHFEGARLRQISWVIMPNHVHVLFVLHSGQLLADLLHSWKSFTSQQVNALLGKKGALWQKDYFDRLVRDGEHLDSCIRYIRRNPSKAKLREDEFTHFESPFAKDLQ